MRYLSMIVGASLLSVGLLAGSGPAHAAMPTLALDRSAVADTAVEKVCLLSPIRPATLSP